VLSLFSSHNSLRDNTPSVLIWWAHFKRKKNHIWSAYTGRRLVEHVTFARSAVSHLLRSMGGNSMVIPAVLHGLVLHAQGREGGENRCGGSKSFCMCVDTEESRVNSWFFTRKFYDGSKWDDKHTCLPWSLNQMKCAHHMRMEGVMHYSLIVMQSWWFR
jgi:hypothetical protein